MRLIPIIFTSVSAITTGCTTTNSTSHNTSATKIVMQADSSKIKTIKIPALHKSFLNDRKDSPHNGTIVELQGEVVAFALTEDGLYTVTLRDGDVTAVCIFNDSISDDLGDNRTVHRSASITIRGQCHSAGLFASSPFSIDGCQIVE
jgi:hypothetical protein